MAGLIGGAAPVPTPRPDPTDFTHMLNTPLHPQQIAGYGDWLRTLPAKMDKTGRDYDLQGAYLANLKASGNGHLDDTFKKPNHPTFSTGSNYSGGDYGVGGRWTKSPDGRWTFTVSPDQLRIRSAQDISRYFTNNEPDGSLVMPSN